nr:MAG: replication associated protein [Cressdnaviricota sp.]
MESNQLSSLDGQCTTDSSAGGNSSIARRQGRYWLCTIPRDNWEPCLPTGFAYCKGQLELGADSSYYHWQVYVIAKRKCSLHFLKSNIGEGHFELSYSKAAENYVWKEATRVAGSQFEYGDKPIKRSSAVDWDRVWDCAIQGRIMDVPSDIRIRCYSTLRRISEEHMQPLGIERTTNVFWGVTGSGKSSLAWKEAGMEAYCKDPRSKFWCGYRGQTNVIIDEFRGGIDIAHLLRWLDRYPCIVEVKGGARPLCASTFWITSNIHPRQWYPDLDEPTLNALLRRMVVTHFDISFPKVIKE